MGRPLTALWTTRRKLPAPAGCSLRVCQVIRKRPESLIKPIVLLPVPCHDPIGRVTVTSWRSGGDGDLHPEPASGIESSKSRARTFRRLAVRREAMRTVCGGNRVERAVPITKNTAQACDSGVGQGTHRRLSPIEIRRWADAG